MSSEKIFVGFYFARDFIIHAFQRGQYGEVLEITRKKKSPKRWQTNLDYAAQIVLEIAKQGKIAGIGMAVPGSFRIRIDENDPDYGFLGANMGPKRWQGINVKTELLHRLKSRGLKEVPRIKVISQVGATSWGDFVSKHEDDYGPNAEAKDRRRLPNNLYVVADAGIGASLITKGDLFHGEAVPMIGHTIVHVEPEILLKDGSLPAPCPYHPHRPCLNCVASLQAIEERWNLDHESYLASTDQNMVSQIAFYIAQALTTHAYMLSPEKIVLSGRVAEHPLFIAELKDWVATMLEKLGSGSEASYASIHDIDNFIEEPKPHAGVIGAVKTVSATSMITMLT